MMLYAQVIRDSSQPKGPGKIQLVSEGDQVLGEWSVITGSANRLDPKEYGGLTPPITWRMVEAIESRKHPKGHTLSMARIFPVDRDDMATYNRRTFALDDWPFMVHAAGTSTGCIAVVEWAACRRKLNEAWIANGGTLEIDVVEAE